MKRLITLFALIAVWASSALAHDFEVNGIYYVKNSDGTSVSVSYKGTSYSQYSNEYSGSVTIPSYVAYSGTYYDVTMIGSSAFSGCSGLTSVTIPNSVTSIGTYAFYGCSGLTSVTIPNSVTTIGTSAFYGCSGLTKVEISDLAAWCGISFGNTSSNPLNHAKHLYLNGSEIKDLVIPNSVTSIRDYTFYGCSGLESVTIPNSVTSIGTYAFNGCSGLTSVTIPNSVTSIGSSAFSGCSGLTSVTIPNSVTSIGNQAFNGCSGLASVTIPNSVTSIGTSAFNGCNNIETLNINNNKFAAISYFPSSKSSLKTLILGNNVSSIVSSAFSDCTVLTSMTIGNSVTTIGTSAFNGCGGLTSVAIPNSVTSIGQNAFTDCSGLTKVEISDIAAWCRISFADNYSNPLNYAKHLYLNGSEIKDLVIPNTLTAIKNYTFCGCIGLTSVTIGNSVTSIGDYAFRGCSGLTSVAIGESVTSIGQNAFSDNSGLKTVNWNARNCPDFTSANVAPFKDLTGISSFNFGNEVNKIPAYICFSLSGLASVAIGESVTSIGDSAFRGCSGLTSVAIGESVTSIGNSAFANCIGLTSVTIPNSVTSVGTSAFQNCGGLTSVTIGNSVASIGQNAFQNCSGLTSVTLPHSVTEVGQHAFQNCSGLASLTIGKSVSSIGSYAFDGCTSLTLVTDYSPTPQSINAYVFNNLSLSNIDLMVPAGCSAAYRAVAPWKYFKSIEEILSLFFSPTSGEYEESVTVLITATVGSEIRYTLDGTEPASTSTLYTEPIVLNEIGSTTVIKAIAIKDGIISDIETATYTIKLAAPTITPSGGTYNAPVTVSMSAPQGSDIYFTTDGTDPSVHSLKYYEPFVVNGSCTIKAIAVSNNLSSAIISRSYIIDIYTPYPKKNGLTVTNLWLHSLNGDEREGAQYWANLPFANSNYDRTSLIYGDKVYVAESKPTVVEEQGEPKTYNYATLHVIDALTGTFEKSVTLTDNGQPVKTPSPTCFNQIGVDNYGNVWGCGYTANCHNMPLRPYVINLEDGTVTYVGECQVPDTEETAGGRVDFMDVVGDITGVEADGILMTAPSNTDNIYAYRWRRAQGSYKWKGDFSNNKVAKKMSETYPAGQAKWGGATILKIIDSNDNAGNSFYIDDFTTCPVLYNNSGVAVDGFQNRPELAPKTGPNGVEEFSIGSHKMLAWVYNQYDVSYDADIAPAGGCVIKVGEFGSNRRFSSLNEYWTLPKEGLGMQSDGGSRIHSISTQKVTDGNGKEGVLLLTHKCRNGLGVYLVAEDGFDGTAVSEIPESPVISPEAGVYEGSVTVSITSPTDGVAVRYTLDGTEPNSQSSLYVQPFTISELGTTEVKAVAVLGNTASQIATASFTIISGILSTPTFSPEAGEYAETVTVTMSAEEGAEIRYTIDGTEPTTTSAVYSAPLTFTENTTVKAIAVKDGQSSEVVSSTYTIVHQVDHLYVNDFSMKSGDSKEIAIQLDNETSLIACEFYMQLPEGFSIAKDDDDYYVADLVSGRINRHTLEVEYDGNGIYHFLCYSNRNNAFVGNSGDFITLTIAADDNVAVGEYTAELKDIIFSDIDKNQVNLANNTFSIEIINVTPGDVNDDGKVNVMDIVEMVSYIMGSPSATFVFAAADLDGNGTVNVMDLVNLVEMIMTSANQAAAKSSAKELMTVDCVELVNAGKNTVSVAFPGTEKFVAAQFTVELKNGNTLNDVTTGGNHRASFTEIGEGKYMVLVYSPDNSIFEGDEAIRLSVNNGKNVTIDNAVLVDVDKNAVTCNAVSSDNSCGVISIEADFSKPVDIYNLNGQLVRKNATLTKGLDKGFYIINNNKIYLR